VDDEDWVRVQVIVEATGFAGGFEGWLQLEDLKRFKHEVEVMYAEVGTPMNATLGSAEPDIWVQMRSLPLGNIEGTYRFESERRDGKPTALLGAFSLDQSFLPELAQSIMVLVTELGGSNVA